MSLMTLAAPLRKLTQKGMRWAWTQNEQTAFETLKHSLTTDTVNGHFDPSKQTEVHVDPSPVGLGAILSQTTPGKNDTQIIAYVSRSLTKVESRYSQIEREALGIVYGIEHFHLYLYGHDFRVITDHKPLETIFANPKCRSSARLERWCLRLQDYNFTVKFPQGVNNPSDFLSRHPLSTTCVPDGPIEEYISCGYKCNSQCYEY